MSAKDSDTREMLDWTMTAAPTAEEAFEAPAPSAPLSVSHPHHPRQFSRWMWLTLGSLTLIVIFGLMVFSWGNRRQVAADVQNVFLAEEAAAHIGDTHTLAALTAHGYTDWLNTRLRLAQQDLAAPAPALLFNPDPAAGEIISLNTFAPDIMQADIRRTFTGPQGETTHFVTTQFYQFQSGWKRTPTPPFFSGELHQFVGQHLTAVYFERDADLINTLGPYLDAIITNACLEWNCDDTFKLTLQFLDNTFDFEASFPTSEPLIFRLLAHTNTTWLDTSPLNLPAPHIVGTPADDLSLSVYQQLLGQQVLLYAAQSFAAAADGPTRNALTYALTVRLAARLKLEPASNLNIAQSTPATDLQALWDLRAVPIWENIPQRQMALRSALVTLNALLQDQTLDAEERLFQQLRRRNNARGWLADGLRLEYADIQSMLAKAGQAALAVQLPTEAEPDLVLQCVSGPQLYFEAQAQVLPFASGPFFDAQILGWPWPFTGNNVWSPDGNYLLLSISGKAARLDLAQRTLTWLNLSGNESALLPQAWISDTVMAYLAQSEVRFLDIAHPEQQFPSFPATDYVSSADGAQAALVWNQDEAQRNGLITMLAAGSAELLAIDAGFAPVWMRDSEHGDVLVYAQYQNRLGQTSSSRFGLTITKLRRAQIVNGIRYTVQEGDSMWSIVASHNTSFDAVWGINQMTTNLITPGQVLILPIEDSDKQMVVTRDIFTTGNSDFLPWMNIVSLTSSAAGDRLAVVLESQADDPYELLLLKLDGSISNGISPTLLDTGVGNPERLLRTNPDAPLFQLTLSEETPFIVPPRFSADGDYVAIVTQEQDGPTLKVYFVKSGLQVYSQLNTNTYAWSPIGHRLAIATNNGVTIVNDMPRTGGTNTVVTHEACEAVWWRPEKD